MDEEFTEIARHLHALPPPEPPPELRDRVIAAVLAEQRNRRVRRRRLLALAMGLQCLVFIAYERTT